MAELAHWKDEVPDKRIIIEQIKMKRKSNSDGKNSKPLTVIKAIPSRNLSHLKVNNNTLRNVQFTALIPPVLALPTHTPRERLGVVIILNRGLQGKDLADRPKVRIEGTNKR